MSACGPFGPDVDTRTVTPLPERGYPYIAYKVLRRGEEFSDWSNTVTVMFHAGRRRRGPERVGGRRTGDADVG